MIRVANKNAKPLKLKPHLTAPHRSTTSSTLSCPHSHGRRMSPSFPIQFPFSPTPLSLLLRSNKLLGGDHRYTKLVTIKPLFGRSHRQVSGCTLLPSARAKISMARGHCAPRAAEVTAAERRIRLGSSGLRCRRKVPEVPRSPFILLVSRAQMF